MNRTDEFLDAGTVQEVERPPPVLEAEPPPPQPAVAAPVAVEPVPPASPPLPPARARRPGSVRRWRARLIVVLMLAGAVFGGLRMAQSRSHAAALLHIDTVTLTADPVPVQSDRLGLVTAVKVKAHQQVVAGQELGRMSTITMSGSGLPLRGTVVLEAPVTGIVSDGPRPVGSALQPGDAFVELYQPSRLTLVADVPLADLPKLAPGMEATLTGADLPTPIAAVVGQAIPRVGDGQSDITPDHIALQFVPKDRRLVAQLVPGLRFEGSVDTESVRPGERKSVYVGQ
jgi:multidrug resistance efflux pump